MPLASARRQGFTIPEVLVALLLSCIVLGALQGTAAFTLRRLRISAREAVAVRLVQRRGEQRLASLCTAANGADTSDGVVNSWSATTDDRLVRVVHTVRYATPAGERVATFQTSGACQ